MVKYAAVLPAEFDETKKEVKRARLSTMCIHVPQYHTHFFQTQGSIEAKRTFQEAAGSEECEKRRL
jgi:hypothetical protein